MCCQPPFYTALSDCIDTQSQNWRSPRLDAALKEKAEISIIFSFLKLQVLLTSKIFGAQAQMTKKMGWLLISAELYRLLSHPFLTPSPHSYFYLKQNARLWDIISLTAFLWILIARNQGNTTITPQKLKQKLFLQAKQMKTKRILLSH